MFPYYIIRRMEKEFTKDILSNNKKDKQNFPNRHLYIRLNKRSASLIINSLALTRRYLYYKKTEEIPLEIFFNTNDSRLNVQILTARFTSRKSSSSTVPSYHPP